MKTLSYHNVCLDPEDLGILKDGQWLNDKIIGFMLEYFENDEFKDLSGHVSFVSPEVTQFIKLVQGEDEMRAFLEPLCLTSKELVLFPINDNTSYEAGGTHWSLLLYQRKSSTFLHFDSYGNSNENSAKALATKVSCILQDGKSPWEFQNGTAPMQNNSYDCGVYTISFIETICRTFKEKHEIPVELYIKPEDIAEERKRIKDLILRLCKS